jgi:hypothetical protein
MRRWAIVCLGLCLHGCSNDAPAAGLQCTSPKVPSETQYTCPSPPLDAGGCHGGPSFCYGRPADDPDLHFPVGCQATLPCCDFFNEPELCTCG